MTFYVDEGLRVLLAEDFFIYVVNESDCLVYVYCCEMWAEWLDVAPNFEEVPVTALIPFAHRYIPERLAKSNCNYCRAQSPEDQATLEEWEAEHGRAAA